MLQTVSRAFSDFSDFGGHGKGQDVLAVQCLCLAAFAIAA